MIVVLAFFTSTFVLLVSLLRWNEVDPEGERAFECGIGPSWKRKFSFSYQFFVVAILFLIFDIEISLVVSICLEKWGPINVGVLLVVVLLLLFGAFYEWKDGKISWSKWMNKWILQVQWKQPWIEQELLTPERLSIFILGFSFSMKLIKSLL